jgi:hypothetical protein
VNITDGDSPTNHPQNPDRPAGHPAQRATIVPNNNGYGDIDAAVTVVRTNQPTAPVAVTLVVGRDKQDGDHPCGIAIRSNGKTAWIPKERLVDTGGARGELSSHLGRAKALGASVDVHVVPNQTVTACNRGVPYTGINGLPLTHDRVKAAMHPATIDCIQDCLAGRS